MDGMDLFFTQKKENEKPSDSKLWGGVGVKCIDWSPTESNMLAAVTLKTGKLEIWDVEKGMMEAIYETRGEFKQLKWSLHESDILVGFGDQFFFEIDCLTGKNKVYPLDMTVTAMTQHPKRADKFFFAGTLTGKVFLYDLQQDKKIAQYQVPTDGASAAAIKDIVYSPGEDVFLVVRKDGQMYLFGTAESAFKMEFPAP